MFVHTLHCAHITLHTRKIPWRPVCDVKVFLGEHLRSESHNFDERIYEKRSPIGFFSRQMYRLSNLSNTIQPRLSILYLK